MRGVGDEAHLRAIGLIDAIQHGIDGLGQGLELLLGAADRNALIQVGGVDLIQPSRQSGELLRRHGGGVSQPGGRSGQLLNGFEGAPDGARVFKQIAQQTHQLADKQHPPGKDRQGDLVLQIQGDGVGFAVVGQGDGVGHVPARMRGPGAEEEGGGAQIQGAQAPGERVVAERTQVEIRAVEEKAGPVWGLGQCGHGIVPGGHPDGGLGRGHTALLHQGGHIGTLPVGPEQDASPGQQQEEKVHKDIDAQQTQEKTQVQPQDDGGFYPPPGLLALF